MRFELTTLTLARKRLSNFSFQNNRLEYLCFLKFRKILMYMGIFRASCTTLAGRFHFEHEGLLSGRQRKSKGTPPNARVPTFTPNVGNAAVTGPRM